MVLWDWAQRFLATGLPPLAIALLATALGRSLPDLRERWLAATTVAGAWVILSSEILSFFGRLDRAGVVAAWTLFAAAAAAAAAWARRQTGTPGESHVFARGKRAPGPEGLQLADWILFAVAAAFAATLLGLALATPPNGEDVLAYHLARVMRWIDHRSLAHFPAPDFRTLQMPPFSSLAMLHLLLLWGTDRLLQTISWCAAIGGAVAASAIARRLGVGPRGQWLAAIFFFTSPVVLSEAASCFNDVLVCFWILVAALGLVRAFAPGALRGDRLSLLWSGTAAGLAAASKTTAPVYLGALILVALAYGGRRGRRRAATAARVGAWISLPILLLNLPHWWRNQETFGSPTGSPFLRSRLVVEEVRPGLAFSNLLRAVSRHADTVGMQPIVPVVERAVRALHRRLGLDPDDPRTTMGRGYRIARSRDGSSYGSGWHLLAALAAGGVLARRWRGAAGGVADPEQADARRWLLALAILSVLGTVLTFTLLRWQHFAMRFGLPGMALLSPLVGWAWSGTRARILTTRLLCSLFLLAALPTVVGHPFHPLIGPRSILHTDPITELFDSNPSQRLPILQFTNRLRASSCRSLGLYMPSGGLEYPFWRLLNGPLRPSDRFQIAYLGVANSTRNTPRPPVPSTSPADVCAIATIWLRGDPTVNRAPWSDPSGLPPGL